MHLAQMFESEVVLGHNRVLPILIELLLAQYGDKKRT